jgi:large subunit ribosomal protein L19
MNNFIVKFDREKIIRNVESKYQKQDVPKLSIGDTVKLGVLIKEGNKERTQFYEGIIIAFNNHGLNKTMTVRKVLQGIGVERVFLIHSPKLQSIEVIRMARVRRAKLYYLRKLSGKASRLKQRFN